MFRSHPYALSRTHAAGTTEGRRSHLGQKGKRHPKQSKSAPLRCMISSDEVYATPADSRRS